MKRIFTQVSKLSVFYTCLLSFLYFSTSIYAQNPTVPTGLNVVSNENGSVTIGWNAATSASGVKQYEKRSGKTSTSPEHDDQTTTTTYTFSGLDVSNPYFSSVSPFSTLEGVEIFIQVRTRDNSGAVSDWSPRFYFTPSPRAPQGLTGSFNQTTNETSLSWNASFSEAGLRYDIYRSESSWGGTEWNTTTTGYTIPAAANGPFSFIGGLTLEGYTHRYAVKAVDGNNTQSGFSNTFYITPPPAIPKNVHDSISNNTIILYWNQVRAIKTVTDSRGGNINEQWGFTEKTVTYNVYQKINGGVATKIAANISANTYTVTNVPNTNGTISFYITSSISDPTVLESLGSIEKNFNTPLSTPITAPINVTGAANGNNLILNWGASTGGSGTLTYYVYATKYFENQFSPVNPNPYEVPQLGTTNLSQTINLLYGGGTTQPVKFKIRAKDAQGNLSGFSNEYTYTPTITIQPITAPTNVTGTVNGNNLTLNWSASTGGTNPITYEVFATKYFTSQFSPINPNPYEVVQFTTTSLSQAINLLYSGSLPTQEVRFKIRAKDAAGYFSAFSNEYIYTPSTPVQPLTPPTNVTVNVNGGEPILSCTASSGGIISNSIVYEILAEGADIGASPFQYSYLFSNNSMATLSFNVNSIVGNVTLTRPVRFKIRAKQENNVSAYSNEYTYVPSVTGNTPPSTPINIAYSNLTTNGVLISWAASTGSSAIVLYEISSRDNSGFSPVGPILNFTSNTTSLQAIYQTSTSRAFKVRAKDANGNYSAWSIELPIPRYTPNIIAGTYKSKLYIPLGEKANIPMFVKNNEYYTNTNFFYEWNMGDGTPSFKRPANDSGIINYEYKRYGKFNASVHLIDAVGTLYSTNTFTVDVYKAYVLTRFEPVKHCTYGKNDLTFFDYKTKLLNTLPDINDHKLYAQIYDETSNTIVHNQLMRDDVTNNNLTFGFNNSIVTGHRYYGRLVMEIDNQTIELDSRFTATADALPALNNGNVSSIAAPITNGVGQIVLTNSNNLSNMTNPPTLSFGIYTIASNNNTGIPDVSSQLQGGFNFVTPSNTLSVVAPIGRYTVAIGENHGCYTYKAVTVDNYLRVVTYMVGTTLYVTLPQEADIPQQVMLVGLDGNLKRTFQYSVGQPFTWDISNLPGGNYILSFKVNNAMVSRQIIISR